MKIILWQPRSYGFVLPTVMVLLAMMVETVPLSLPLFSYLKPALFFITIWYFHFHYPKLMPLWVMFILALVYDIETAQRVGVTAIALWFSILYPRFFRNAFHEMHAIDFLLKFVICMIFYTAIQQGLMVMLGDELPNFFILLSHLVVSMVMIPFLWRLFSFLDSYLSRM